MKRILHSYKPLEKNEKEVIVLILQKGNPLVRKSDELTYKIAVSNPDAYKVSNFNPEDFEKAISQSRSPIS